MSTDAGMNRGTNRPMSTARTNSFPLERSTPRSSLESPRDRLPSRPSPPSRAVAVPVAVADAREESARNQSITPTNHSNHSSHSNQSFGHSRTPCDGLSLIHRLSLRVPCLTFFKKEDVSVVWLSTSSRDRSCRPSPPHVVPPHPPSHHPARPTTETSSHRDRALICRASSCLLDRRSWRWEGTRRSRPCARRR